jgi:hypothetical protein
MTFGQQAGFAVMKGHNVAMLAHCCFIMVRTAREPAVQKVVMIAMTVLVLRYSWGTMQA